MLGQALTALGCSRPGILHAQGWLHVFSRYIKCKLTGQCSCECTRLAWGARAPSRGSTLVGMAGATGPLPGAQHVVRCSPKTVMLGPAIYLRQVCGSRASTLAAMAGAVSVIHELLDSGQPAAAKQFADGARTDFCAEFA